MAVAVDERVRRRLPWWSVAVAVLIAIMLVFIARRLVVDIENLGGGSVPDTDSPDHEYALHPVLAWTHIGSATVYMLAAPLQLWAGFRMRHYAVHRSVGRILVPAAVVSTVTAIAFGFRYAFGGDPEAIATLVFGGWVLVAIVAAFVAIRRGDVVHHRRWMIRAFVVSMGVGTIRIWIGAFSAMGVLSFQDRFALSFWLAFTIHVIVAEWWLVRRPDPPEAALSVPGAPSSSMPEDGSTARS